MEYSLSPDFISFSKFFRGGHLLDLDWLWEVTIREIRLDLGVVYSRGKPFIVVMTDVQTGDAVYQLTGAGDLEQVLKASSAMPLLYRDYPRVGGRPMTDGGVADALPVGEAIRRGARRIMVIRSRPRESLKCNSTTEYVLRWHVRRYPLLRQAMAKRIRRYNEAVELIRTPPNGVSIIEICPPENFRVSRLSKDRRVLQEGYGQGRALAGEAMELWKRA
ncbi:MAG: patatin-like phospholipase family protein [Syntrophales bacterium]